MFYSFYTDDFSSLSLTPLKIFCFLAAFLIIMKCENTAIMKAWECKSCTEAKCKQSVLLVFFFFCLLLGSCLYMHIWLLVTLLLLFHSFVPSLAKILKVLPLSLLLHSQTRITNPILMTKSTDFQCNISFCVQTTDESSSRLIHCFYY